MRPRTYTAGAVIEALTALRLPGSDWAEAAAEDLAGAGCRAAVIAGPDCDGCFTLLVRGPRDRIAGLRAAAEPRPALCWMTLVNEVLARR